LGYNESIVSLPPPRSLLVIPYGATYARSGYCGS
jgi:hypothetical protein